MRILLGILGSILFFQMSFSQQTKNELIETDKYIYSYPQKEDSLRSLLYGNNLKLINRVNKEGRNLDLFRTTNEEQAHQIALSNPNIHISKIFLTSDSLITYTLNEVLVYFNDGVSDKEIESFEKNFHLQRVKDRAIGLEDKFYYYKMLPPLQV